MTSQPVSQDLLAAARVIRDADAIVVAAGAGMGVDSGLPDFRGTDGFWRAYPAFAALGLRFEQLANPSWFARDPRLAWGFYGHRLMLYRKTNPHRGFGILRRWAESKSSGGFVFTSNVDGHFQLAGFADASVIECHGSIHFLQCSRPCSEAIWSADAHDVVVDPTTFRAADPLPTCQTCGGVARPNILMFGDNAWIERRTSEQFDRYTAWLDTLDGQRLTVIECGAGSAVPTVRNESHRLVRAHGATLVRINVREPHVPAGHLGLSMPARDCLDEIDRLQQEMT